MCGGVYSGCYYLSLCVVYSGCYYLPLCVVCSGCYYLSLCVVYSGRYYLSLCVVYSGHVGGDAGQLTPHLLSAAPVPGLRRACRRSGPTGQTPSVYTIIIIILIINLGYIGQLKANSILTVLYIVIKYLQTYYIHKWINVIVSCMFVCTI